MRTWKTHRKNQQRIDALRFTALKSLEVLEPGARVCALASLLGLASFICEHLMDSTLWFRHYEAFDVEHQLLPSHLVQDTQ